MPAAIRDIEVKMSQDTTNKMLNTLLTAAGVTKTGGAPADDLGDASLPKGLFTELQA